MSEIWSTWRKCWAIKNPEGLLCRPQTPLTCPTLLLQPSHPPSIATTWIPPPPPTESPYEPSSIPPKSIPSPLNWPVICSQENPHSLTSWPPRTDPISSSRHTTSTHLHTYLTRGRSTWTEAHVMSPMWTWLSPVSTSMSLAKQLLRNNVECFLAVGWGGRFVRLDLGYYVFMLLLVGLSCRAYVSIRQHASAYAAAAPAIMYSCSFS